MKPNILYIHSHDTGRYVSPYGHDLPTPNIQRLAEDGVVFRNAHNAGPTCSPSRAALLTGQVPHSCGQFGLAHRGFELAHRDRHLAGYLAKSGYASVLCGVNHVVKDPSTVGYGEILRVGDGETGDHAIADAASRYLIGRSEAARTEPFFLAVGFASTHREYPEPGSEDDARYVHLPPPIPDTPDTRKDMAAFSAGVRRLDQCMGIVFDALEESGLAETTLVVCTTDHGIAFPFMKCNLTAHGTGVMLILKGPGGYSGGVVSEALVSHLDVFPTICDVAGLPRPGWLQGHTLPSADRLESEGRDEIYSEVNFHAAYEPKRAVRTKRWNYIRRYGDYRKPVLANIDDGLSKSYFLSHGLADRIVGDEELYDLVFDPYERHNLAGSPEWATELDKMRNRMDRWMKQTDDPILDGPIPIPPGAKYNSVSDFSPREPPIQAVP